LSAQQARHWRGWTPWTCEYGDIDLFDDLIPFAVDAELRELGQSIVDQQRIFLRVNEQLAQAMAMFFGLPVPETERDFQGLWAQAEDYRRQVGAAWTNDPELQVLIDQLQSTVAEMKSLGTQLRERLEPLYARLMLDAEGLGDQRAKDLIDEADEEPDSRRAIRLLNKALSYGQTGLFARSAYAELGRRHSDLGNLASAIEYYTKSLQGSAEADPYVLFGRGQLHYEQERWDEARADFERALSIGLFKPDSDQAREYLADIRARETD
jgi:tetratricopeptide (TPR) repeat protein